MSEPIFSSIGDKLKLAVALFLASGAAVSFYFVGVFAYLGLELMALIDKQSLVEAILFYATIFSVVLALATLLMAPISGFIPVAPPQEELPEDIPTEVQDNKKSWFSAINRLNERLQSVERTIALVRIQSAREANRWRQDFKRLIVRSIPALMVAALLLILGLLHAWRGLLFVGVAALLLLFAFAVQRLAYQLILLLFLLLGLMHADHLMEAEPTSLIHRTDGEVKAIAGTIVLASARGVLAVVDLQTEGGRGARFFPWERVSRVELVQGARNLGSGSFQSFWKAPQCLPFRFACLYDVGNNKWNLR